MSYYDRPNQYIGYQIGSDLTAWRNADAKLTTPVKAVDDMLDMDIGVPLPVMEEYHPVGLAAGEVRIVEKGKKPGELTTTHKGQTSKMIYWHMQKCTTTEATPNIHAITMRTSQTPINIGIHVEREKSSEDLRYDLLGLLPVEHHWKCPDGGVVEQSNKMQVAFAKTTSTDDIAKPTRIADRTFTWDNLKTGGITFNYGGNPIEADIVDVNLGIYNTPIFSVWDATKHPSVGLLKRITYDLALKVKPTGSTFYDMNKKYISEYAAGGIDMVFKWQRSATDYVQYTYADLRMVPVPEKISNEEGWFEEYDIKFMPGGLTTSAFSIESKDIYNNNEYENPA